MASLSKLRGVRALTRSDHKARKIIQAGIEKWHPNLRFVTLTAVGDFPKTFRKLKYFLTHSMGEIEYFGVRTGEGQQGVVHFVYSGETAKGVRYGDLSKRWEKISGYWNVSISKVRNYPGMIDELTRQHQTIRYFHSRYWHQSVSSCQRGLTDIGSVSNDVVNYRYKLRSHEDSLARCKRVKL